MWLLFTPATALCLAAVAAASFVLVLYAWRPAASVRADRDHPDVIRQRVLATGSLCLVSPLALWLLRWTPPPEATAELGPGPPLWEWLGLPAAGHSYVPGSGAPLLLTASLFLGPVLVQFLEAVSYGAATKTGVEGAARFAWGRLSWHWSAGQRWQSLRNLIAAPICEEVIFRAVVLSLLVAGGFGFRACVLLSPLLFGIAHLHHLMMLVLARGFSLRRAVLMVSFQLGYTTLFGAYAAALFLRTNHLLGAVLAHAWCNLLGLPDLAFLSRRHPLYAKRVPILLVFVAGMVIFALALRPLTDDQWLYGRIEAAEDPASAAGELYKPLHTGSWMLHYQHMRQRGDMDKFL